MNTKLLVFILLMPVIGQILRAQEMPEYLTFMQESGYKSVLFRGRAAQSYSATPFNGTYYWSSPEFKNGSVMYNGKLYTDVLLNIDANSKDLLARSNPNAFPVALDRNQVEYCIIDQDKFLNLKALGYDAKEGFYQVLKEGVEPVFLYVSKNYQSSTDNVNGDLIGYDDPEYNAKIYKYFGYEARYYVYRSDKLKKISGNKAQKLINGK